MREYFFTMNGEEVLLMPRAIDRVAPIVDVDPARKPYVAAADVRALRGTYSSGGSTPLSVAVGDFNDDGKSDLAVANDTSDNVSILLGSDALWRRRLIEPCLATAPPGR